MELSFDNLLDKMMQAAGAAFGDGWEAVKDYAPAEFKKISFQIVEIAENVAKFELDPTEGYPAETGRILLQMQRTATESVLIAISTLTLIAVQNAINAIFDVLKDTFGGALSAIL